MVDLVLSKSYDCVLISQCDTVTDISKQFTGGRADVINTSILLPILRGLAVHHP